MRLVTFQSAGRACVGVIDGDELIDLAAAMPGAPESLKEIIAKGVDLSLVARSASPAVRRPLSSVQLLPPIGQPGKIVCLGLNYAAHAAEGAQNVAQVPTLFLRVATSLTGHGQPMILPRVSEKLDFEAELMVIIGKGGRHIEREKALDHVFGYSLFNDGSVRDFQRATTQWTAGKNFDRTGAFGPAIVTADELPAGARGLRIRSILNGQVMQDANTENMVFDIASTIQFLSTIMTLEPGDCIATGTPEGVGFARKPPVWLKAGDVIAVEVEKVGRLENTVMVER